MKKTDILLGPKPEVWYTAEVMQLNIAVSFIAGAMIGAGAAMIYAFACVL